MVKLCHQACEDASDDTSCAPSKIHEGDKVLRAERAVSPALDNHDCISYHVCKRFTHACRRQHKRNNQWIFKFKTVDRKERDKLNNSHKYQVALPPRPADWNIIRNKSVQNFERPG